MFKIHTVPHFGIHHTKCIVLRKLLWHYRGLCPFPPSLPPSSLPSSFPPSFLPPSLPPSFPPSFLYRATEAFQKVLELAPNFARVNEVHLRLGVMCKMKGANSSGLQHFQKALSIPGPSSLSKFESKCLCVFLCASVCLSVCLCASVCLSVCVRLSKGAQ